MLPEQPDQPFGESGPRFLTDIRPLFRERDRQSMLGAFDLWSYDDVVTHGPAIVGRLKDGTMPCDGPWPAAHVELVERWLASGAAK